MLRERFGSSWNASVLVILLGISAPVAELTAADCNQNGVEDSLDIAEGESWDCNGDGTPDECPVAGGSVAFAAGETYRIGESFHVMLAGDFDGDNDLDILLHEPDPDYPDPLPYHSRIWLCANPGNGDFEAPVRLDMQVPGWPEVALDFNGDGRTDLVCLVPDYSLSVGGSVDIYLSEGAGLFSQPVRFSLGLGPDGEGMNPDWLTANDFDGNGSPDLAFLSDGVTLLLNQPGGFVMAEERYPVVGQSGSGIASGDLDGDSDADLVVGGTVLFNDGAGRFGEPVPLNLQWSVHDPKLADLDGDGYLDLIAGLFSWDLCTWKNDGSGAFLAESYFCAGGSHLVADLDADGRLDFVGLGEARDLDIGWRRNKGDGTYDPPVSFVLKPEGTTSDMVAGYFDEDLDIDLVILSREWGLFLAKNQLVSQLDCNANGVPDGCDISGGVSSDCNGNGIPDDCEVDCDGNGVPDDCDISGGVSSDCNRNGIPDDCEVDCDGNGVPDDCDLASGEARDCNQNGVPDACDIAGGVDTDLDGNEIPDGCEDCNHNGIPDGLDLSEGSGLDCNSNGVLDECDVLADASFTAEGALRVGTGGGPFDLKMADLDGDGKDELIVLNYDSNILQPFRLVLGADGRLSVSPMPTIPASDKPFAMTVADLNGDSKLDIAVSHEGPWPLWNPEAFALSVLFNEGGGTFGVAARPRIPARSFGIAAADLTGDSRPDLVVALAATPNTSIAVLTNGPAVGRFGTPTLFTVGAYPNLVATGDLDGDGYTDIATTNADGSGKSVSILFNAGQEVLSFTHKSFAIGPVGTESYAYGLVVADIDADGDLDLAGTGFDTGRIWLLENQGARAFRLTTVVVEPRLRFLAAGDVDGDGDLDLVATGPDNKIVLAINEGEQLRLLPPISLGEDLTGDILHDFDGDGIVDLAIADYARGTISLLINQVYPDSNLDGIPDECQGGIARGDANQDGSVDISDAVWLLGHLFLGTSEELPCEGGSASNPPAGALALLDVNGDVAIDMSDAITMLASLFLGVPAPLLDLGCEPIAGCPARCVVDPGQ